MVTGATGNVGREVVFYLRQAGLPVVAAKRSNENMEDEQGLEYRTFDFTDQNTWKGCLEDVEQVFLMRPPHISRIKRDMVPFIRYLKEKRVAHLVFLSVQGAESNKVVPHYTVEQACIKLALPYTFIRPSFFMQNLTTTHLSEIRDDKQLFVPTGSGKTNFIDVRDIGELSARILMDKDTIGKAFTVTGDRSYSYSEVAGHLSRGLKEDIRFVNPGVFRFLVSSVGKGRRLMFTLVMLALYTAVRMGNANITSCDAKEILGRDTRSLDEFISDHRALLKG